MFRIERLRRAVSDGSEQGPQGTLATDVRTSSQEGLDFVRMDSAGRLYWDGKPVEMARTFRFTWIQSIAAVLTVGSALAVALIEVLRFLGFGAS